MLVAILWKTQADSFGGLIERGTITALFVELTEEKPNS